MRENSFHPGGYALTMEAARRTCVGKNCRVLDIGCAAGESLAAVKERFSCTSVGVDISEIAIKNAKLAHPDIEFYMAPAEALPFPDRSFDVVLMECSLTLFSNPEEALKEAKRVLRENGRLAISALSGAEGDSLVENGKISLNTLQKNLTDLGFSCREITDHTGELIQRMADIIFSCGSLQAYCSEAEKKIGGKIASLRDFQGAAYHMITARLGSRFTTAEDLHLHPERFLRVPPKEIARIITIFSSGSTAQPKRVFFTKDDMEKTVDFFTEGMQPMIPPGKRCCVMMPGPGEYTVGGLLTKALARFGASADVFGYIRSFPQAALAARGAHCIVGLPGELLQLAEHAPQLRPRTVLLSGDSVSPHQREEIRRLWDCEVFTHWGMTETAYGGAVECAFHHGCHLRPDLTAEIVDPRTGEPIPEGEWGELVVSAPWREGMPLFRYRTGDRTRLLPGVCSCGKPGLRIDPHITRLVPARKAAREVEVSVE